jgi:hypothetical protein
MNAPNGQIVNRYRALGAKLLACAAGCALVSGCIAFQDAQVDPRSPVAKEVAASVKSDAPYPTFAGVPSRPKNVRPLRQFGVAAAQVDRAAAQLAQATADDKWTLTNTETFAAQAQTEAGPAIAPPATAETEAFAAAQRKRATPPPRAKH